MKDTFLTRKTSRSIPAICIALILAISGINFVAAQTNGVAAASITNSAVDASQFPGLENMPGKKPPQIWKGLAGVWTRAHARWSTNVANDHGAVVFLGDSITEGWSSLAHDFPNLKVADRGIGGDITCGVLYRLQADVLSLDPAAIVLLIGTNDVGDNGDPEDIASNIQMILEAIKKFNPHLKVIVCKVMPRGGQPIFTEKIQKLNSLIEKYVSTQPNFAICDTWSAYADDKGAPNPVDFKPDLLHLNPAGYAVWKATLDPIITKLNLANIPAK